jgi:signal recognition particle receptor subunit beta
MCFCSDYKNPERSLQGKKVNYKIIVTGPVGAGKTTAINTLTDHKALLTDAQVSDSTTSKRKETTTVAMDYGSIELADGDMAHIYGTPGQKRFEFMWDILVQGAHSLIILLDNSRNYPFRDLKYYSQMFADFIKNNGLVVGVTWSDKKNDPPIEAYQQWLNVLEIDASVMFVDAREKNDMLNLLESSLKSISQNKFSEIAKVAADKEVEVTASTLAESSPEAEETVLYEPQDKILLTEKSLAQVQKIKGVTGVTLTNSMGELLQSTINDDQMNEFIAFLSGMTTSFEDIADIGEVHRIMLRGPKDDNLTVFVEKERSLGVSSEKKISIPALSQEIEDMLQWSE